MENQLFIFVCLLLVIFIVSYAAWYLKKEDKSKNMALGYKYSKKTEAEIYEETAKSSKEKLIDDIRMCDVCMKKSERTAYIVPLSKALLDKREEFCEEELFELLASSKDYEELDELLISMYFSLGCDRDRLKGLFYGSNLSVKSREEIIKNCDFSVDELSGICYDYDNSFSVIAMKKLIEINPEKAFDISYDIIFDQKLENNSNKLYIAALGIFESYKNNSLSYDAKAEISLRIREIFERRAHLSNDLAVTQLILVLSSNKNFEDYKYLIQNPGIELEVKKNLIEKNIDLFLEILENQPSDEDLRTISLAMNILPIREVQQKLALYNL